MTYWEGDADEYLFEWDTSECGTTTTTSCFDEAAYGGSLYNPLWRLKWQGTPSMLQSVLGTPTISLAR